MYITLTESRRDLEGTCRSHGWSLEGVEVCDLARSAANLAGEPESSVFHPSETELGETTQAAERNEELLRLADALAALPEPQREVVVLKHLRGWTLQRIAQHLNRSVPSVASLLRRGLEELRRRLAPEE